MHLVVFMLPLLHLVVVFRWNYLAFAMLCGSLVLALRRGKGLDSRNLHELVLYLLRLDYDRRGKGGPVWAAAVARGLACSAMASK